MLQVGLWGTKDVQRGQMVGELSHTLVIINGTVFLYYFPQGICTCLSIYKQGLDSKNKIR